MARLKYRKWPEDIAQNTDYRGMQPAYPKNNGLRLF